MPRGSLKLAALLQDVVEKPDVPAADRVSLDVLKDAEPTSKAPATRNYRLAALVVVVGLLGVAIGLAHKFELLISAKLPAVSVETASKPELKNTVPASIEEAEFSKPVQELMQYVECYRKGQCAFKATVQGEEAAKQFGYSRLFASAYDEVALKSKLRAQGNQVSSRIDITADFEHVVKEEQSIDKLLKQKQHAAAIAYLRALQNGDVTFPTPQAPAPAPQILLIQLMAIYPEARFDINDPAFAAVYGKARDLAAARLKATGEIWAQQVISEFRHFIIVSAASPTIAPSSQSECKEAYDLSEMVVITEFCPHLVLSLEPKRALQQPAIPNCPNKASTILRQRFESLSATEVENICQAFEDRVRTGKLTAFALKN